jgi:hypothetical protein
LECRTSRTLTDDDNPTDARARHEEPDILVFNNMSIIKGLPLKSPAGPLEGIDNDASVAASLINVSESLESLAPRSWKYLVGTSRHSAAARALATRTIDCAFREADDPSPTLIDRNSGPLPDVAQRAVTAFLTQDESTLNVLAGGAYPEDTLPIERSRSVFDKVIPAPSRSIQEVKTCSTWGNRRLAFVDVVTAFESSAEVGYRSLLAIVDDGDDHPRLLALGGPHKLVASLRRHQQLLTGGRPSISIDPPMLVSPEDRSSHDRMPIEHRPTLEWRRPSNGGPFFYLIESQEGEPGTVRPVRWQNNQFSLVSEEFPDIGRGPAVIRMRAPFGAGHQPGGGSGPSIGVGMWLRATGEPSSIETEGSTACRATSVSALV